MASARGTAQAGPGQARVAGRGPAQPSVRHPPSALLMAGEHVHDGPTSQAASKRGIGTRCQAWRERGRWAGGELGHSGWFEAGYGRLSMAPAPRSAPRSADAAVRELLGNQGSERVSCSRALSPAAPDEAAASPFITVALRHDRPAEAVQRTVGRAPVTADLTYDGRPHHPRRRASFAVRYRSRCRRLVIQPPTTGDLAGRRRRPSDKPRFVGCL